MLQAIISHTPYWVWAILAVMLYRGMVALRDRQASFLNAMLFPLVLAGLSLHGLLSQFHRQPEVLVIALLVASGGVMLAWRWTAGNVTLIVAQSADVGVAAASAALFVRGSWRTLIMTVSIFTLKYSVGVTQAMHPEWLQSVLVSVTLGLFYGMFAGLSLGRVLRICQFYRQAHA